MIWWVVQNVRAKHNEIKLLDTKCNAEKLTQLCFCPLARTTVTSSFVDMSREED